MLRTVSLTVVSGSERPEGIARHTGNLASVLETRGDLDGAEELSRKALEIDD